MSTLRPHARPAATTGVVETFDSDAGLGDIHSDDGAEVRFHCTQIAGGSRDIATGTRVGFAAVAGRGGRWEAASVTPLPAPGAG